MRARWFVMMSVASASAFAGAMALPSCSSDSTEAAADGGDAGDAHKPLPAQDTGPGDQPDAGPGTCPTTTTITTNDIKPTWQPPPAIQTVCTQKDIDALKAAYAASSTGSVTYNEIRSTLGATCAACVFSPLTPDGGPAATWSVFVDANLDAGTAIDNSTASCFAEHAGDICGKARHDWESCLRLACKTTDCGSTSAVTQCKKDVQKGACKDLTTAYVGACPNESALLAACNVYGSIAAGCAGGPDAGIDASK